MIDKVIGILIVILSSVFGNIYWHKKIIVGKWFYTIYTTILLIIYLFVCSMIS